MAQVTLDSDQGEAWANMAACHTKVGLSAWAPSKSFLTCHSLFKVGAWKNARICIGRQGWPGCLVGWLGDAMRCGRPGEATKRCRESWRVWDSFISICLRVRTLDRLPY